LEDITKFFPTPEDAEAAWNLFDKDGNGDATRDEVEMTCMCVLIRRLFHLPFTAQQTRGDLRDVLDRQCHREQLSIEHSMRDLDSAVGRLDNIFMSLYAIVVILIIAVALVGRVLSPGSGILLSDGSCRRLNCSPSSPERELLSLARCSLTYYVRTLCLTLSRS